MDIGDTLLNICTTNKLKDGGSLSFCNKNICCRQYMSQRDVQSGM